MNAKTVTLLLALAACATIAQAASGADRACTGVPRLIVDTDMYTDIDSGAVALAHVLADRGECELEYDTRLISWTTPPAAGVRFALSQEKRGRLVKDANGVSYARCPGLMLVVR